MSAPTFLAPETIASEQDMRLTAYLEADLANHRPQPTRVLIESPISIGSSTGAKYNELYGREALRDSLMRGEAPMASHMLYTQTYVLDESNADERAVAEAAGASWLPLAEAVVVYSDRGTTPAMQSGIDRAKALGIPVEYRSLEKWQRG